MKKLKKPATLFLVFALLVGSLTACGNKNGNDSTPTDSGKTGTEQGTGGEDASSPDDQGDASQEGSASLPLTEEPVTLSMFIAMDSNLSTTGMSYADTDFFKEMEARTGVHIDFQIPATGEETTAFNLMIASGELPDLIARQQAGVTYPDGLDAAVDDGYYLDLTPYLDTHLADYNKLRNKDDFTAKSTVTDSGRVVAAYQIYQEPQGPWCGLQVRKDWLDDLGLDMPVTFDDWEVMLTKFKDEKGAYAPLSIGPNGYNIVTNSMSAAFGATCDFMNVDGTVVYGPITDGWKEYLALMHDWYSKNLIDPDFMTGAVFMPDMGMVTTGQVGAWDSMYTMPSLYEASSTDSNMYIVPVASPVKQAGDEVHIRLADSILGVFTTVSADTKYPELCMKWINYLATEEGSLLMNYGIEGKGLAYGADGNPTFSALVTNNPDGLSVSQAQCVYAMAPSTLPGSYDWKRELGTVPEKDLTSYDVWGAVDANYIMPTGLTHTGEESKELASITTDITTFMNESSAQFITGVKNIETDWDAYVETIKSMKIDRALQIKQDALDRFNAR